MTHRPTADPVVPRPAATVVLVRHGRGGPEVLLTQRPSTMVFGPDLHVFPGGAVDPADADARLEGRSSLSPAEAASRLGGDLDDRTALGFHIAALRELFEEAGVLLAERRDGRPIPAAATSAARDALLAGRATLADVAESLDLRLRPERLVPLSHWTTPPVMPRRFDTRFFVAELPPAVEPTFAADEVVAHRWATPRRALDAMTAGEIDLWVPTSATLQQLQDLDDVEALRRLLVPGRVAPPRLIEERPGLNRIVLSGAGGIPGQTVNAYLVGRGACVVVDPGDPSDEAAVVVLGAADAASGRIELIALTSADPTHAAGAEGLALRLGIPIVAGPAAGRDLPYEVRELADGERLRLDGATLTAIATPGPRPEHLVLDLDGALLVGDLVGAADPLTARSFVDRSAWTSSLERLATMGTMRLYPGHGEPRDALTRGSAGE